MTATVEHILQRKGEVVHAVAPHACVSTAVQLMNAERIGSVLVLEGSLLRGILSERDVLHRVISDGRSPEDTRVEEVMTRGLWTVAPDTPVRDALALVSMTRCRHLPVLYQERVVGLISLGDLTAWIVRELHTEVTDLTAYIHGTFSDRSLDEAQSAYEIQAMRGRGLGVAYPNTHYIR
jgi:CBS domain-containing protein